MEEIILQFTVRSADNQHTERRYRMERLKIAVSGSNGFLGGALAKRLEQSGHQVFKLGRDGAIPKDSHVVFDCAAYGNLSSQRDNPHEIYNANLLRVIESINNLPKDVPFIFVSTSSVLRPKQNLYSLSKRAAEDYIKLAVEDRGIKAAIIRPYAITGVGEQEEHLIPTLIRSCLNGEEMPFVGWPVHDFIDVEDVVDAMLIIKEMGKLNGEVYEVGRGIQYTNQEVLDMVEKVSGRQANTKETFGMRSYDSKEWFANTTTIKNLGWEPEKSLEQSIKEMVNEKK